MNILKFQPDRVVLEQSRHHHHLIKKYCQTYILSWCRHGRDRMVVGFTTTCAISAYHH